MRVRPLGDDTAQRLRRDVAVESIAQVVQWLLQNSLDAGADEVVVHLQDAHSVMVEDNGRGIARSDLPALCEPGGTLASAPRRGASLARIASVACITITSRPAGSFETCVKTLEHGNKMREGLASTPRRRQGTTVEVSKLFHSQPVRARHTAREERHVAAAQQVVLQAAACCTHVAMRMTLGPTVVVDLPKQLWALPADALCPVHVALGQLTIEGVVGVPSSAAHDAMLSTLWVDGCVKDADEAVGYLSDVLADVLQRGRKRSGSACVALFALHVKSTSGARLSPCWEVLRPMLDAVAVQCWGHWMPLSLVQRLQDGNADVVAAGAQERSLKATPRVPSRPYKKHARTTTLLATPSAQQQAHVSQQPLSHAADLPAPPVLTLRVLCDLWKRPDAVPWSITREELHQARLLHQVDNRWLAVHYGSTLALVDQHGADERVRLEYLTSTLMHAVARGMPPSTTLPSPLTVRLTTVEAAALLQHAVQLQRWGWRWRVRAEAASGAAVLLTEVPCILGSPLLAADFKAQVAQLDATRGAEQLPQAHARLLASKACRMAVMFGTTLPRPRCLRLLEELRATQHCFSCAHGRPTVVPLVDLRALENTANTMDAAVPQMQQGACSVDALVQHLRGVLASLKT